MNNGIHFLIADDDLDDLEMIKEALSELSPGSHIVEFNTGSDVINYISFCNKGDLPSLMILDYNMPLLTGQEVIKRLSENELLKDIPKFILSTSNSSKYKTECERVGAAGYFEKPNSFNALKTVINGMLTYTLKSQNNTRVI